MPRRPADAMRTMPLPKGEWLYSLRFLAALEVAVVVFATTRRKKTQIPYVAHLLGVCAIVLEHGGARTRRSPRSSTTRSRTSARPSVPAGRCGHSATTSTA